MFLTHVSNFTRSSSGGIYKGISTANSVKEVCVCVCEVFLHRANALQHWQKCWWRFNSSKVKFCDEERTRYLHHTHIHQIMLVSDRMPHDASFIKCLCIIFYCPNVNNTLGFLLMYINWKICPSSWKWLYRSPLKHFQVLFTAFSHAFAASSRYWLLRPWFSCCITGIYLLGVVSNHQHYINVCLINFPDHIQNILLV